MSAPISVLVELRQNEVHIQELAATPEGLALDSWSPFELLGTVRQVKVPGARGLLTVWRWESEGESGDMTTKRGAVTAMLADAGYTEVKLTATIPDLLDGLEGGGS